MNWILLLFYCGARRSIEHKQFCKDLQKKEIMTYAISECVNFVSVAVV